MSVVNQFEATDVRWSTDPKKVYILDIDSVPATFEFDIYCVARTTVCNVGFFFNIKRHTALILMKQSMRHYVCAVMRFHVQNDVPIMSANWLHTQEQIVSFVHDDFKQQYAAYLLDNIVNE